MMKSKKMEQIQSVLAQTFSITRIEALPECIHPFGEGSGCCGFASMR